MYKKIFAILSVLILLCAFYYFYYRFSVYNTIQLFTPQGGAYMVHRAHNDGSAAAHLLSEINSRNEILISHLRNKYLSSVSIQMDPSKSGRIDIIHATEMYDPSDLINQISGSQEYIQERVNQLIDNYNPSRIYEISPRNAEGVTSYTENKRTLILCLRHKSPNSRGEYELHDINTMMFVVLHELCHMMNDTWNHPPDFWILFKFILNNAVEAGIYTPIDYSQHPINYCGLWLKYNPLYDARI